RPHGGSSDEADLEFFGCSAKEGLGVTAVLLRDVSVHGEPCREHLGEDDERSLLRNSLVQQATYFLEVGLLVFPMYIKLANDDFHLRIVTANPPLLRVDVGAKFMMRCGGSFRGGI